MVIASIDSFPYKVLFLLHIFAVIVAFAPAFVNPVLNVRYRRDGQKLPGDLGAKLAQSSMQIHGPALVLTGLFGLGLIGLSDTEYKFSQTWVSIALLLWFIMIGVLFALLIPAERKYAGGDDAAESRVSTFSGMMQVLLLLMLIDMIWKPGL